MSGSADQFHLASTGQPDIHTFLFTFSADHYKSNIIQIEQGRILDFQKGEARNRYEAANSKQQRGSGGAAPGKSVLNYALKQ